METEHLFKASVRGTERIRESISSIVDEVERESIAKNWSKENILKALEIIELRYANTLYEENGDITDRQMMGFSTHLENMQDSISDDIKKLKNRF